MHCGGWPVYSVDFLFLVWYFPQLAFPKKGAPCPLVGSHVGRMHSVQSTLHREFCTHRLWGVSLMCRSTLLWGSCTKSNPRLCSDLLQTCFSPKFSQNHMGKITAKPYGVEKFGLFWSGQHRSHFPQSSRFLSILQRIFLKLVI